MIQQKYPLVWPEGWKRTPFGERVQAKFHTKGRRDAYRTKQLLSVSQAVDRVLYELRALGVMEGEEIISTNIQVRLDGFPRSNQPEPGDTGAAVYWKSDWDAKTKAMAIDLYDRVADNLAAIAATLSAMRAIERHGGSQILERVFTGFIALPAPKSWREVLGISGVVNMDQVRQIYRQLAMKAHPDQGGSHDAMARLNEAYELAQKEIAG